MNDAFLYSYIISSNYFTQLLQQSVTAMHWQLLLAYQTCTDNVCLYKHRYSRFLAHPLVLLYFDKSRSCILEADASAAMLALPIRVGSSGLSLFYCIPMVFIEWIVESVHRQQVISYIRTF